MDELIQAMSIPELENFKVQYKDNDSVTKIVDGYIAIKESEVLKQTAMLDFTKTLDKTMGKLVHPEGIHNIYIAWREVEVDDTSQEPEIVETTNPDTLEIVSESRYPKVMISKWVSELNKGFQVSKTGKAIATTNKRAITIKKINPDDTLSIVGNFRSASDGCKHLKVLTGGDSAIRVLQREGYLTQAYDGTAITEVS